MPLFSLIFLFYVCRNTPFWLQFVIKNFIVTFSNLVICIFNTEHEMDLVINLAAGTMEIKHNSVDQIVNEEDNNNKHAADLKRKLVGT